jgi:hypothetical protein
MENQHNSEKRRLIVNACVRVFVIGLVILVVVLFVVLSKRWLFVGARH